jgi:hypothetical protein
LHSALKANNGMLFFAINDTLCLSMPPLLSWGREIE